ncbi:FUSC family protein [Gordonia malaquae]|uniref:FUSC family protein n=1 Tax=Gordonia malaquae TaxID=410332 RepID=UPI003017A830
MKATVRPDRDDHHHALRVLAGLLVPMSVLLLIGRPELLVYAVFGSFAGMYGRRVSGRPRIVRQVQAAGLLTVGVAIGVTLAHVGAPVWVLVIVETVYALVCSLAADVARLRPAGPFFFIFALGATATVPPDLVAPPLAVAICGATAVLAVGIGMIGFPHPLDGKPWLTGMRWLLRTPPSGVRVHAVRYALAVGVAGTIGTVLGFDHANWAMAAAAVPLAAIDGTRPGDATTRAVLVRAGHRTLGTFAGLLIAAVLLAFEPGAAVVVAVAVLLLWPTELFMSRHYAVAIGFFTPLIMLMTELTAPAPPLEMLTLRGVDTLIGVAVGVAVAVMIPAGTGRRKATGRD